MSFVLHGSGVSSGIAIGQALLISHATLEVAHLKISVAQIDGEFKRLDAAITQVNSELATLRKTATASLAEVGAFVDLHEMLLSDPELIEATKKIIKKRRCNAEWALVQQMENLVAQFESFEDAYLRERRFDVVQVVERVIKALVGQPGSAALLHGEQSADAIPLIAVAHDLSPADVISFKEQQLCAFITDVGGSTSHTAILARSMDIPAIVGLENARALIQDGDTLVVDGILGAVLVNPVAHVLEAYRLRQEQLDLEQSKLMLLKSASTTSLDDIPIQLLANVELPSDVSAALDKGADGIGLFRTEFLFLGRHDMPDEDEQYHAYRQTVENMAGYPVTIRTFDLGGDKAIDTSRVQTNPALGRRAIRLSLTEPQMFQYQLRAILRASRHGQIKILIPMLSHLRQIDAIFKAIERAKESLRKDGLEFDENIQIGSMIEIPAAALAINMFIKRFDFLSIGTNDLIQYTLAIDRIDEQVAHLYDPLHPAILMLLDRVLDTAKKSNTPVSVCGEMAGDPDFTRFFLGLGLRTFSVHPSHLLKVKAQVLKSNIEVLEPQAKSMIGMDEPQLLRAALNTLNASSQ